VLHVALWEPEIPPNTGNIARLCAATGTQLHLIGRLGFRLDDRSLRRAGVDYWAAVQCFRYASLEDFDSKSSGARLFGFSARAERSYTQIAFQPGISYCSAASRTGFPKVFSKGWQTARSLFQCRVRVSAV